MSLPYQPNGIRFSANMGLGQPKYSAPPPSDPRTPFTGSLSNVGAPVQGNHVTPVDNSSTFSQLGWGPAFSGYYPTPGPMATPPQSGMNPLSITQLQPFHQNGFANVTNKVAAAQPQAPLPKPPEPTQNIWGGGFGKSDNSAWGNALGPTLEQRQGLGGQFQPAANQPSGHVNQALPPGYGSVFGLGAGSK